MKVNPWSIVLYVIGGLMDFVATCFLPIGISYATGHYYKEAGQIILISVLVVVVFSFLLFAKASELNDIRKLVKFMEKQSKKEQ